MYHDMACEAKFLAFVERLQYWIENDHEMVAIMKKRKSILESRDVFTHYYQRGILGRKELDWKLNQLVLDEYLNKMDFRRRLLELWHGLSRPTSNGTI